MKVSKNLYKGGEITDLREIKTLAIHKKSIYVERGGLKHLLPAAFILGWQFSYLLSCNLFYTYRDEDITEVEFENEDHEFGKKKAGHLLDGKEWREKP